MGPGIAGCECGLGTEGLSAVPDDLGRPVDEVKCPWLLVHDKGQPGPPSNFPLSSAVQGYSLD